MSANTNDSFRYSAHGTIPDWLQPTAGGTAIKIRVVPRSQRDSIQGVLGDSLKVRLKAPPVENKANRALLEFLAERLAIPVGRCVLQTGATGRLKRVVIEGLDWRAVLERLMPL